MGRVKNLAERLSDALAHVDRKSILRFPCACVIQSNAESCRHVDAFEARKLGLRWKAANDRAEARRREEKV